MRFLPDNNLGFHRGAAARPTIVTMTAPTTLFRPFSRLIKITILGREVGVPENNTLLRCFQYLAPEAVSYGRFCWNEECQYCRISFDLGEGTNPRAALACKVLVEEGMRVKEATPELRYCLSTLPSQNP
jgi:hypothetical protein